MRYVNVLILLLSAVLAAPPATCQVNADLAAEVREAERAFAGAMAARSHAAFVSYLAEEAVFFSRHGVLRGKAAVAEGVNAGVAPRHPRSDWYCGGARTLGRQAPDAPRRAS
jgi:uncharacterized protein DUF4440